jgi:hypothetical protein
MPPISAAAGAAGFGFSAADAGARDDGLFQHHPWPVQPQSAAPDGPLTGLTMSNGNFSVM